MQAYKNESVEGRPGQNASGGIGFLKTKENVERRLAEQVAGGPILAPNDKKLEQES